MPSQNESGTPVGIRRTVLVLAGLYFFDSWFTGQGLLSLLVSFLGAIVLGVGALTAIVRGRKAWATSRAARALVYVLLAGATVATLRFHAWTAEAGSLRIIDACKGYHARHGDYPAGLADLVPEFLAAIPRAKYTGLYGEFQYWTSSPDSHTLMYVAVPPAGRRLYNFEAGRWSELD